MSSTIITARSCYIVFTKTRAGNQQFYCWILDRVVDFVDTARKSIIDPEDQRKQAWFQLDGEWTQIQMFSDSEIISQIAVVVGRLRGSTTNINQPADQNPFKACKTKLKVINDQNISDRKKEKSILRAMIEEHRRASKSIEEDVVQ
jgi:hypothetical protein